MRRVDQMHNDRPAEPSDQALWRYCRAVDAVPDEEAVFLDLAGFVDGRLDADEHERVAALLGSDPDARADVAAAKALVAAPAVAAVGRIVDRAIALAGPEETPHGRLVPFVRVRRPRPSLYGVARWGSLAAAILVASWLGFALGSDTSLMLDHTGAQASEDNFLGDLLDPAGSLLTNISNGLES